MNLAHISPCVIRYLLRQVPRSGRVSLSSSVMLKARLLSNTERFHCGCSHRSCVLLLSGKPDIIQPFSSALMYKELLDTNVKNAQETETRGSMVKNGHSRVMRKYYNYFLYKSQIVRISFEKLIEFTTEVIFNVKEISILGKIIRAERVSEVNE